MSLTKTHFEDVARVLRVRYAEVTEDPDGRELIERIASDLAVLYARANQRFDRDRFLAAATRVERYRIMRRYRDNGGADHVVKRGLTLAQAQAHCADPQTSSSTATEPEAVNRTVRMGPWFDGYEPE